MITIPGPGHVENLTLIEAGGLTPPEHIRGALKVFLAPFCDPNEPKQDLTV